MGEKRVTILIHIGSSDPKQGDPWITLKLSSPKSEGFGWALTGAVRNDQPLEEISPDIVTSPHLLPAELEQWLQGNCDTDEIGSVEDLVTSVLCKLLLHPGQTEIFQDSE